MKVVETAFGTIARVGTNIYVHNELDAQSHQAMQAEMRAGLPQVLERLTGNRTRLRAILASVDALELLAQFSLPYLAIPVGTPEWANDRLPAHVEYLATQVLALGPAESRGGDPIELAQSLEEVEALVRSIFDDLNWKIVLENLGGDGSVDQELRVTTLMRNTTVRMPVYVTVERDILHGLFEAFSNELKAAAGFDLHEAERCTDYLLSLAPDRILAKAAPLRAELDTVARAVKRGRRKGVRAEDPSWIARLVKVPPRQLKGALVAYATNVTFRDSRTSMSTTIQDLAAGACVSAGAASAYLTAFTVDPSIYDEEHHRLPSATGPLRERPLLFDQQLGRWLPSVPAYLWDALRGRLEAALLASRSRQAYLDHRGNYLEKEATRLLAAALPGSDPRTATKWRAPNDEDNGDLDGLVIYHDCALRIQAKSGSLHAPARRGAPGRMRKDLASLVGEAAEQHHRLRAAETKWSYTDLGLGAVAEGLTRPLQFDVIVTLEDLGGFVTEAFKLVEYGALRDGRLPWIVSLHDLTVITDQLQGPHLVHYLCRRERLNRWARVHAFEELDWLGHYMHLGLYFDEQLAEPDGPDRLRLQSFTDELDAYYLQQDFPPDRRAPRPVLQVSEDLSEMLRLLLNAQRVQLGTLIACCLALDGDDESRQTVGHNFRQMLKRSREQGSADFTQGWASHGLTFCYRSQLRSNSLQDVLKILVERHREEQDAVLWIGIGKALVADPVVVVRTDGRSLAAAAERVLCMPHGKVLAS